MKKPNFKQLRASGFKPRVHPNGFIQLDIVVNDKVSSQRLHIWPDVVLQKQKSIHPIHDHRFSMISDVIKGTLMNKRFRLNVHERGTHNTHLAKYTTRHDAKLHFTREYGDPVSYMDQIIPTGDHYVLPYGILHESVPLEPFVATIMRSYDPQKMDIRVMVPRGVVPDNDFDRFRDNHEDLLWEQIEKACE